MACCHASNETGKDQIVTFDLQKLPDVGHVKLSELGFEDITYIPLQTTPASIISRINEIKTGNGFFLIKFFNTILEFKEDGSFIAKIGSEGRGPTEFTVAHDLDIDKKNRFIYLVSAWQKKFIVYSESGKFLRIFPCPISTTNFIITEDGILCYSMNSLGNIKTSFNLIDIYGGITKSFPNKYTWNKVQSSTSIFKNENIFYRFNNRFFIKEIYSDTVYMFENKDFKPHIIFKQGEKLLSAKARSEFSSIYLFENFIDQNNLFEFGDYIYFEFMYGFKIGGNNNLYGFVGSKKNDFKVLINLEEGFLNDLDGGPNIWPKTVLDDYTVISWVDAIHLKTLVSSEAFKKARPKYPAKKRKLEELANSLKETDNPVLILVTLNR
jgi:hypothetical protein